MFRLVRFSAFLMSCCLVLVSGNLVAAALTYASGVGPRTATQPTSALFSPDKESLYITGGGGAFLQVYSLGESGDITNVANHGNPLGYGGPQYLVANAATDTIYVGNSGGTVLAYSGYASGELNYLGTPSSSNGQQGIGMYGLAIDPEGAYLYALGWNANSNNVTVTTYAIGEDGTLTVQQPNASVGGQNNGQGGAIAVSPDGKYLYTVLAPSYNASANSGQLAVYQLKNHLPASMVTQVALTMYQPGSITVDQNAGYIYVGSDWMMSPNGNNNQIAGFTFDGSTLTPVTGSPWATAYTMTALAVDASGSKLYAAGYTGSAPSQPGYIQTYWIDPTSGVLTADGTAVKLYYGNPSSVAVSDDARLVAVTAQGPATNAAGMSVYTATLPAFGAPLVERTPDAIYLTMALENVNAEAVSAAGVYYGTQPMPTSTASVAGQIQDDVLRIKVPTQGLTTGASYYFLPFVTLDGKYTYTGTEAASLALDAVIPQTPSRDYSNAGWHYSASYPDPQPATANSYGFLLQAQASNALPTNVPAAMLQGVLSAAVPASVTGWYGDYTVRSYVTGSGITPISAPGTNAPSEEGGVIYYSDALPISNLPVFTLSAASIPSTGSGNTGVSAKLSVQVGDLATSGAKQIGFCYSTDINAALPECKSLDTRFQPAWSVTLNGLAYETTYYVRAYIQYANGMVAYSAHKTLLTPQENFCHLTPEPSFNQPYATVWGLDQSQQALVVTGPDQGTQTIKVLDASSGKVRFSASTGGSGVTVVLDQVRDRVYYAYNQPSLMLYGIDLKSNKALRPMLMASGTKGYGPVLAVDEQAGYVFVSSSKFPAISRYDADQGVLGGWVNLGIYPDGLVVNSDDKKLYVSNNDPHSQFVNVIDYSTPQMKEGTLTGVIGDDVMRYDSQSGALFLLYGQTLMAISGETDEPVAATRVGMAARGFTLDRTGNTVYVDMGGADAWAVPVSDEIGPKMFGVPRQVPITGGELFMEVDPLTDLVFTAGEQRDLLSLLDGHSYRLLDSVPVKSLNSLARNQKTGWLYLGSDWQPQISVFSCR